VKDFACGLPGSIVFGQDKLKGLPGIVGGLGKKCLLVADPFFVQNGLAAEVAGILKKGGIDSVLFSKVSPNPRCHDIDEGAALSAKEKCEFVLAVGGGSGIDTGKAIAVVVKNGGGSWDYVDRSDRPARPVKDALPVVVIPTTAGTGTEATAYAVLSNPDVHEKGTIISNLIFPRYAVVDPSIMESMPPALTALTGIDALAHCIEAFLANIASPFSSMVAKEGIRVIARNLPEAVANGKNKDARAAMAWGSVLGGMSIGHAGVGLPHAMGQPVGGIVNAPHGGSVAACLAQVVAYSFMSSFPLFAELAVCLDESVACLPLFERAEKSVELINRLFGYVGCRAKYSDYGMKASDIDHAVDVAFKGYGVNITNYPRIATPEEVTALYKQCL
jgi:alcohol dehydrogenase class IV